MADLIDFEASLKRREEERRFERWNERLGTRFRWGTRIRDLPDEVLLRLAEGGMEGSGLLEELILSSWRLPVEEPTQMEPRARMALLDLSLLLIDHFRFECMTRLGWLDPLPLREVPLLEILLEPEGDWRSQVESPRLRKDHPHHHRFQGIPQPERETYIRKMIPAALERFRRRVRSRC
jgi:hypothetical protein